MNGMPETERLAQVYGVSREYMAAVLDLMSQRCQLTQDEFEQRRRAIERAYPLDYKWHEGIVFSGV